MIAALAILAVFVAVLGRCALEAARDARLRWREEDACERIGRDQVRGVVERLTMRDLSERAR